MTVRVIEMPDGAEVRRNEKGVEGATRVYLITGLTSETHLQATQDAYTTQGVPQRGYVHPVYTNIYAFNHDVEKLEKIADGSWKVQVAVSYSLADTVAKQQATTDPENPTNIFRVRKFGSADWKTVYYDVDNNPLYTGWKADTNASIVYQGASIQRPFSNRGMTITFTSATDMTAQLKGIHCKRNDAEFYGEPIGCVLCIDYDVSNDDFGATFDATATFSIKDDWAETFSYTDPQTGCIPGNFFAAYNAGLVQKSAQAVATTSFSFLTL